MRDLVAQTSLQASQLVLPMFVREGITEPQPISSMPGVVQHSRDSLRKAAVEAAEAGLRGVMLFGVPETKDAIGSGATDPDGILNVAIADVVAGSAKVAQLVTDKGADAERDVHTRYLQHMIDLDVDNTRRLLALWEQQETETFLVSDVGETSFIFGENFGALLQRKLALTEQYRDRAPRIDSEILWRLP